MVKSELKYFYDNPNPTKPSKARIETKVIKEKIKLFVENKVEFIAEIPSVRMVDSGLSRMCSNLPFLRAWPKKFLNLITILMRKYVMNSKSLLNGRKWIFPDEKKSYRDNGMGTD